MLSSRLSALLASGLALAVACGGGEEDAEQPSLPAGQQEVRLDTGSTRDLSQRIARWKNPASDGWDSEVIAGEIEARLHRLGDWLIGDRAGHDLARLCAVDRLSALRPPLALVRDEYGIAVRRQAGAAGDPVSLEQAFGSLTAPFELSGEGLSKFKVVSVERGETVVRCTALYELRLPLSDGRVEQHATWHMAWRRAATNELLLAEVVVEQHAETRVKAPGKSLLTDCTSAVLGADPSFRAQLARGLDHWSRHVEELHGMGLYRHWGAAIGDVNGDGLDDIYLCQTAGLPNRLFLQQPDGSARDAAARLGVDLLDHSSSALLVDLDEDGDPDLAVATHDGVVLYENDGTTFARRRLLTCPDFDVYSLSAADFDGDKDLDLYVTTDFAARATNRSGSRVRFDYVDANDGGSNRLFRSSASEGKPFVFHDCTEEVGLDVTNRRHSLAAAWEDFDRDGDLDLYVANDYGQNCLYRNTDGHFEEVAAALGVVDHGSGMSAHWGDFDRDGLTDLYVANMFSSAGRRVTSQPEFMPHVDEETRALYARFAKGNTLFKQQPDGTFAEVPGAGVEMGRWAWSSLFVDLDLDGYEDLLVANGYITTEDTGDL